MPHTRSSTLERPRRLSRWSRSYSSLSTRAQATYWPGCSKKRRAVERTVFSVQLVGEFVQDQVFSVAKSEAPACTSSQESTTTPLKEGFAEGTDFAFQDEMTADMSTDRLTALATYALG